MSNKAVIYTDGGCMPNTGKGGWGLSGVVGKTGVDAYGTLLPVTTNNKAELTAVARAIKIANENEIKDLTIFSDSQYVLENLTTRVDEWMSNGWTRVDGSPVKNVDEWKDLVNEYHTYLKDGKINLKWVKGHSGVEGNEKADQNATRARILAENEVDQPYYMEEFDIEKPKKPKTPDRNHMLSCPRWYFDGGLPASKSPCGRTIYHCGFSDKDDELHGKPISDAYHNVVYLKEPEPVLEFIRQRQINELEGDNPVCYGRLDNIFSPSMFHDIVDNKAMFLKLRERSKDLVTVTKEPITRQAKPPGLIFNLMNLFTHLENKLNGYVSKASPVSDCITDFTSQIYDVAENPSKTKILKEVDTSCKYINVSAKYYREGESEPGELDLRLTMGIDLPRRNALAKLAKLEPKIHVLTWPESNKAIRFAVIVETKDDVGIYSAGYSNLRVI